MNVHMCVYNADEEQFAVLNDGDGSISDGSEFVERYLKDSRTSYIEVCDEDGSIRGVIRPPIAG